VINKAGRASCIGNHLLTVGCESTGCVRACTCLANVVWRRARNDNFGTLGDQLLGCQGQIGDIGLHRDTCNRNASLTARTIAVGATVVCGGERSTIVVSKLDDDPVARYNFVGDGRESGLIVIRPSGTAGYGIVLDGNTGEGVWEVYTPTWQNQLYRTGDVSE
jgi:hypothetical protein